jgi:hypothetical protein
MSAVLWKKIVDEFTFIHLWTNCEYHHWTYLSIYTYGPILNTPLNTSLNLLQKVLDHILKMCGNIACHMRCHLTFSKCNWIFSPISNSIKFWKCEVTSHVTCDVTAHFHMWSNTFCSHYIHSLQLFWKLKTPKPR